MSIIITQNRKQAQRLERSTFEDEDTLQEYIFENPNSLPLDEIKEDIRLLVLAREFPTLSGPIDALGIDRYGDIYVIETKLCRNSDRRKVVAQVLDYGAALWARDDFPSMMKKLESAVRNTFGTGLSERLQDFFGITSDECAELVENMKANHSGGKFRFVVLMDHLNDELKDLIKFLNSKSGFAIYAVEMEYYKFDSYEIIIPKLFGSESVKEAEFSAGTSGRKRWNDEMFFDDLMKRVSGRDAEAVKRLFEFAKLKANDISWGTGKTSGSFSPKFNTISVRSPFTVYSDGTLQLSFEWLNDDENAAAFREKWRAQLMAKLAFPIDEQTRYKSLSPTEWSDKVSEFIDVFDSALRVLR